MEYGKIQSFTDLDTWKAGHQLVLEVYKVTQSFPKEETFGLTSQMKRCSVSITSNIAEGFSLRSYKDKIRFYTMARGSITELQNQLLIARDVGFLSQEDFSTLADDSIQVHKILNGLIKTSKSYIPNS